MFNVKQRSTARSARVAVVGALVGMLALGGAPAVAATDVPSPVATSVGSGSISGTVTDPAAAALAGAQVSVTDADGGTTVFATTGSQGGYTVPDLPAGTYYVSVAAQGSDPVFWPDATTLGDAQTVEVAEAAAVTGIDIVAGAPVTAPTASPSPADDAPEVAPSAGAATLRAGAAEATYTVTVHVTDERGVAQQGAYVELAGDSHYYWGQTDASGNASLTSVVAGPYGFRVYPSSGDLAGVSSSLEVTGNTTSEVVLQKPGSVSGHVTSAGGGDIDFRLLRTDDLQYAGSWRKASGAFTIDRVAPGTYFLDAAPVGDSEAPTLYPGVFDPRDAKVITVESGKAVTGIDFALSAGHSITGVVTGAPGSWAQVNLLSAPIEWNGRSVTLWWRQGYATIDKDGRYTATGLADGDYTVSSTSYGRNDADPSWMDVYYDGYYDDSPTYSGATPVPVRGADVRGIDIALRGHGTASGDVGAEGGTAPLKNTLITAYRWNGATWDQTLAVSGWGRYSLGFRMSDASYGLPEGTYTVGFSDPDAAFGDDGVDYPYCPQYWDAKTSLGQADRFEVAAGRNTPGIDATLRLKSEGCAVDAISPGAPTIEGTPRVGIPVTANPGTWGPQPIQLAYQWRANGVDIDGATDTIFTPTAAQAGTKLTVAVTGSRPGYDTVTVVSPESAVVATALITPGAPSISGTPTAGSELTADPGAWTPSDVALAYQWTADGAIVPGATGSTFVPGDDEVGKLVAVKVTGSKPGYTTASATSPAVGPIVAVPLLDLQVGTPRIDGEPRVGTELTASPGTWGPQPVSLTYSWSVGDTVVAGADGPRFTPGPDAVGKTVTVTVRGSKSGYNPATATATAGPVEPGVIAGGSATVVGDPKVGATLTAQSGGWTPAGVTLGYQWLSDGKLIEGATGQTFQPDAALLGATIQVEVTASLPGYTDATAVSDPVGPIAPGVVQPGTPVLSGPALSGVPITVDPGAWGPEPVEFAYQWSVDGQPIEGATDSTYTPTTDQVGSQLTVTIVGSKPGYTSVSAEANAGTISASISLDSSSALPGGAIVVTGTGYEPGETVRVELHSVVSQLGTAVADAEGNFRLPTTVPLSTVPGDHAVFGIGEKSGRVAQAPITVGSPSSTGGGGASVSTPAPRALAVTGTTVPTALAVVGILFVVGGGLLLRRPARRRT